MWYFVVGTLTSIALGALGSLGPCTMATNVAAVGFITRNVSAGDQHSVWRSGIAYAAGRACVFAAVGSILAAGLLQAAALSEVMQHWGGLLLGPVCILTGMALLDMLPIHGFGGGFIERFQNKADPDKHLHAFLLGVVFALAICPVCAALFFGSLLPLAVSHHAEIAYPLAFGMGSAIPVIMISALGAKAANRLTRSTGAFALTERKLRTIVAILFLVAGIFLTFEHVFDIHLHP